jgi:hypothetical protein
VTLINTDGLSLIGPGSEWFWTALSGLVLAVTFLAIYRQLRLQRSAAAIEQLNGIMHEWSSERLCRAKYAILMALQAGAETTELPDRAVATVGFFWQQVGYLVRRGHIDRQLVYRHLGDQVQVWWALLFPGKLGEEASMNVTGWHDFAWLAAAAAAVDAKHGADPAADLGSLKEELPLMAAHFRDAIELEEALRTVTVRLTPTPLPVTSQRGASK